MQTATLAATGGVVADYALAATCDLVGNRSGSDVREHILWRCMADSTAQARGVVMQAYSQDDDLLFCRAVLAFFSHASFPFQAEAGHNASPYLRTFATSANDSNFPAFNT